jgi:hypothetical protein
MRLSSSIALDASSNLSGFGNMTEHELVYHIGSKVPY